MAKAVTRTWYRVALASPSGEQLVAASGEHMGQAIAEAEGQLAGSYATAVEHAAADQIPLGESVGKGHVVSFNFNPMHRDLNRGDHRLLWNALLNWQTIVANQTKPTESSAPAPEPDE